MNLMKNMTLDQKYKIILMLCREFYQTLDNTFDSMLADNIRNELAEYILQHVSFNKYVVQALDENNL
jgi:hypothetical protein